VLIAQNSTPVTITADSLVTGERNGQKVQQLVGHVQFAQGSLFGSADRAIQYIDQNKVELIGNVVIRQDTLSLEAPTVTYDGNTRVGHAEGGVTLKDRDVTLTSREGEYDVNNQTAFFYTTVKLVQGTSTMTANDLTYFRATQTSIARGKVLVVSDSGEVRAEKVTYSKALDETTAEGDVHVRNDSLILSSDWMFNSKPAGTLFARGKVTVQSLANNTVVFGDTLARFANTAYTVIPRSPLVYIIDTTRSTDSLTGAEKITLDTLFIKARYMEAYQGDSTRFIANDSVSVLRTSGFSATGGRLFYDEMKGVMTLYNAPRQRVWNDSTEIVSDSIAMLLPNRKIDKVFAIGHAFLTTPVEGLGETDRIQQLQGERMTLRVEQDTIRDVLVSRNALSMYFLVSNGKADGVNRTSGDTIRIEFQKKAVNRVVVISGTEGEYFPEAFVANRAKAFRLSAFERDLNLIPKRELFTAQWAIPVLPEQTKKKTQTRQTDKKSTKK